MHSEVEAAEASGTGSSCCAGRDQADPLLRCSDLQSQPGSQTAISEEPKFTAEEKQRRRSTGAGTQPGAAARLNLSGYVFFLP